MTLIRPGMGTENASGLLATLVQIHRPHTILEIGAGDSTIALARALDNAVRAWSEDRNAVDACEWCERTALLDPSHVPPSYTPRLITIDDFSGEGTSAELAWAKLRAAGIHSTSVEFVEQDFFNISNELWTAWGPLDMVWIDAGTPSDDVRFVAQVWDRIRPGGYLVLHEPMMLTTVDRSPHTALEMVRTPLWEELSARVGTDFELLTLPEAHKYRQSGVGVIRKLPICQQSTRSQSLQEELLTLGEAPLRNDILPIGRSQTQPDSRADIVDTLRDADSRRAYAAVILGAQSVGSVSERTGISVKSAQKAISRLLAAELITYEHGEVRAATAVWSKADSARKRSRRNLTNAELESPELLSRIAKVFVPGHSYPEAIVSRICSDFSDDYARLRRKLVDDGHLIRTDNYYMRSKASEKS